MTDMTAEMEDFAAELKRSIGNPSLVTTEDLAVHLITWLLDNASMPGLEAMARAECVDAGLDPNAEVWPDPSGDGWPDPGERGERWRIYLPGVIVARRALFEHMLGTAT